MIIPESLTGLGKSSFEERFGLGVPSLGFIQHAQITNTSIIVWMGFSVYSAVNRQSMFILVTCLQVEPEFMVRDSDSVTHGGLNLRPILKPPTDVLRRIVHRLL